MEPNAIFDQLEVGGKSYRYCSLNKAASVFEAPNLLRLPASLRILAENVLRHLDQKQVTKAHVQALADWAIDQQSNAEIFYHPARVLMQDFTGVPAIVDLAAMRDAMQALGKDPKLVNPKCPVDLVIDHSVQVDQFGHANAYQANVDLEMLRNRERYEFLKWGQSSFDNFRVVPPGMGICHQINLEHLGQVIWAQDDLLPRCLVGTDSHTTMINGLGILGWGVGGIEAGSNAWPAHFAGHPNVVGYVAIAQTGITA